MHLELKHLRTLSLLFETGNLNAAAQRLHVTPSALSHQLATLERALGVQLFQRKSRPLSFTTAGLRLLDAAADILPRLSQLEQGLRQLSRGESGR
jgi:LysR family transcriptional regulator for metE and metH